MGHEKDTTNRAASSERASSKFSGQVVRVAYIDFDDGSSLIAPAGEVSPGIASVAGTVGDIIKATCMIFPQLCRTDPDPKPPGKGGCYTIIGPDGTKITICPPGEGGIA